MTNGRSLVCGLFLALLGSVGLAPASTAVAQPTTSLTGTVRNASTGEPLPLANVILSTADRGATTDPDGRFAIDGLRPGRYTVVVTYVGFEPVRRDVRLAPGERRTLDVAMTPMELQVEGVTVTGERIEKRTLGATRLTPEDVKTLPTVLEPDLFRALQLLPGIKAASDFSSGLYIRGGSPDQTLVLLDEAAIYNPSHVFGFFSTFNPDAIGDVTVYKGGYPASYGGRLAAVLDLSNRRGPDDRVRGGLSVGLLASRAYATGPYSLSDPPPDPSPPDAPPAAASQRASTDTATPRTKTPPVPSPGTWMVAVRRSTIEPLLAGLNGAGVEDIPEGFYFWDVNAATRYDLSPNDRVFLSLYAGRDQLDFPFLDDAVFDVGYGNRAATAAWRHVFSDRLFMRWSGTASHYFSNPTATLAGTEFVRDNDVVDFTLNGDVTWTASNRHTVDAGVQLGRFTTRLENYFDDTQGYSPRLRTAYGAAYVQDTYRPRWASDLAVTAGLRVNAYAQGGYVRPAPRLTLSYDVSDAVRLQAGYGRYYQYLSAASTELFSAFDFWLTTDDGVPPSYGDQLLAGVKTEPLPGVSADVEVYYRTMRDLFDLDRLRQDYQGLPYPEIFLYGRGTAYGAEVLLRRNAGVVNGFVAYTLSRTTRSFDVLSDDPFPPKYDRTHDLTTVLNVDFAAQWRATAVFTYATGQAYTEPVGYYKIVDNPFVAPGRSQTPFLSEYNNARLPAYHRLDVGVRKKGRLFGIADYEAQLQLVNAYGRRNVWFVIFAGEENNTISRDVVPQIPVPLPNLSLTLTF